MGNTSPRHSDVTDFPYSQISKSDFKNLEKEGATFGNDKIITTVGFRPSYALAIKDGTIVVAIPVRIIENAI